MICGAREIAEWIKCLLCKHEDLPLDPSTHVNLWASYCTSIILELLRILGAH